MVLLPLGWTSDQEPGGRYELLVRRPGETTVYPATITTDANYAYWIVSDSDTAIAGNYGECVLRYYVGDTLAKSNAWLTSVLASPDGSPVDPPEPCQGWVDQALQAGEAARDAAERAEASLDKQPYPNAETGTWWRWNSETGEYEDTGEPYDGGGGVPPGGSTGQVLTKSSDTEGDADWADLPTFDGVYEVTPRPFGQTTMLTRRTYLDRDIVVKEIPYQETSNTSGGKTATIGG